jgi:hypothetical protein
VQVERDEETNWLLVNGVEELRHGVKGSDKPAACAGGASGLVLLLRVDLS